MQREIEELAEAGRAQAAARKASEKTAEGDAEAPSPDLFDKLMLVGSMTRWARLPVWGPWLLLVCLGPLAVAFQWIFLPGPAAVVTTALLLVLLGVPVIVWRRTWRRNLAWRDRLPFELARYPDCFGWDPRSFMTLLVTFERPPPRKTLEDVVAGGLFHTYLGDPEEQGTDERTFRIQVENRDAAFGAMTRLWLNEWIHDLVDRILRPLHDEYRIRRAALGQ